MTLRALLSKSVAFFILSIISFSAYASVERKPKIVIFTSKGGYGHMATSAMLSSILTDYEVKVINPIDTILKSLDVVRTITFGRIDGETCYNTLMQRGWMQTLNFLVHYPGISAIRWNRSAIEKKIYHFLREEKPDLLFSLIPFFNYPASRAAAQCNIPFLLMTLDMDLNNWLIDMDKCNHPKFHVTVVQKTPLIIKQLEQNRIPMPKVTELGFHVRQDFLEKKDRKTILSDWNLPDHKPKIMVLMGGVGYTKSLLDYTKSLLKLSDPMHLIICVGRNQLLASKLEKLPRNENVSMSIIPFTTRISDLMAASDLLITKPGPTSCYEAVQSGIPTLVDLTSPCTYWERPSIDLIINSEHGAAIKKLKQLPDMIKKYINNKKHIVATENTFQSKIKDIIQTMLTQQEVHSNKADTKA